MNRTITTFLLLFISLALAGQNASESGKKAKSGNPATDYDRLSVSYLLLDFGTGNYYGVLRQAFRQVKVDDKFDDNSLSQPFLNSPVKREETVNSFAFNLRTPDNVSLKIKDALVTGAVPNSVISKWFSRRDDGSFGVELLQQRGLYNATDADVAAANASKLGIARLQDAGEGLLNNSFIIVVDVSDLIDMEEAYNRMQKSSKTTINRTQNGFKATVNTYVYKLDFNDTINTVFWNQLWASSGDADLEVKKLKFDSYRFPISYYTRASAMVEATQYNPGQALAPKVQASQEQLMIKLLNDGITNNLAAIEKTIEEFKVKTSIYSTHPLRAKIGKKEGLKTDQRYFVFEMEQDRAGNIKAKRKGVVRASRNITDNRTVSSGKSGTSRFYQVAGGRLDEGMLLQQRNDAGLALTLGGSKGGFGGFDARLDINISRLLGANMPSMIKLYVEGGYDNTKSDIVIADQSSIHTTSGFTRFGGGLAKEICFAHYFKLQPYAGIGLESTTDKDNKDISLSSFYGRAGILFGLNLRHNIQFVYSLGTYSPFGKITDKENNSILINNESSWKAAFDRGGSTGTFGIRFEF